MPELHQNHFTKEWVIIATERARRPEELASKRPAKVVPPFVEAVPFVRATKAKLRPRSCGFRPTAVSPGRCASWPTNSPPCRPTSSPPGPSIAPAQAWEALASTTSLSTRPSTRTRLPKCQMRTWPTSYAQRARRIRWCEALLLVCQHHPASNPHGGLRTGIWNVYQHCLARSRGGVPAKCESRTGGGSELIL